MSKLLPKLLIALATFLALLFLGFTQVQAAGNLYLSPSSKTVSQGSTFSVSIRVNSPSAVNAVQANLTYPADKLDFISINANGSAFDTSTQSTGGGGSVKIARALLGNSVSGDSLVATVSFRAKVSSGVAVINFAAGTEADNAGNVVVSATSGGTYTFTTPPPPPPPPDTTPPLISNIKVINISLKKATVTWTTNKASDSNVDYGSDKGYFFNASNPSLVTSHSVPLDSSKLDAGFVYHFVVRSKDAAGNEAKSSDMTFNTSGYTVKVTLLDENEHSLANNKAFLYSAPVEAKSDKNGVVTFNNVAPGNHLVQVVQSGQNFTQVITVKDTGNTASQSFKVKFAGLSATKNLLNILLITILGVLIIILFSTIAFWFYKKRQSRAT